MEINLIFLKKWSSKNKLLTISFIFHILFCVKIQSQTIQIINKENKIPISSVMLEIEKINKETTQKKYFFSDDNGCVNFKIDPPFKISARHLGYQNYIYTFEKKDIDKFNDTITIHLIPTYYPLQEVVVTGQIGAQNRYESMNTFITISKEKIQNMSSNNLGELLSNEALFDLNIDPALGTSLSIQGMQGNNVNILIDGVPIIGRKGSQIDLGQIDLSNIDQIEILKGPASVAYGTNSTGGVINLLSKRKKDQVKLNIYKENIGIDKINLNINENKNSNYFNINFGGLKFYGLDEDNSDRSFEWNPKEQNFGEVGWSTFFNKNELKIKSSLFKEKLIDYGDENFAPFNETAYDNHYLTYRNTNYIKINRSDDSYVPNGLISYSITKFDKKQYNVDLLTNQGIQTNNTEYNGQDIFKSLYSRWEYNKLDLKEHQIQFGLDYNYETVSGDKIQNGFAKINEYSIFSQLKIKLNQKLHTQLGIRLPYHSIYDAPITPSINVKYDFKKDINFRVSYARGFRAPTIKELFMEFIDINHNIIGNSNLNSERSHSLQSSLDVDLLKKENKFISFSIEGFINYLKNKITLAQIEETSAYTYLNIENENYFGLNYNLNTLINSHSITFNSNIYNVDNEVFEYTKPRVNMSFSYSYNITKWDIITNFNLKYRSKSEYQRINENNESTSYKQQAYQLINLSLNKNIPQINTSLVFGIKNLLNVKSINSVIDDAPHSSYNNLISWGRTLFIEIKINLINQ